MLPLDTSILVDYLRGDSRLVQLLPARLDELAISSIVLAELYAGAMISARPHENLAAVPPRRGRELRIRFHCMEPCVC